jgi:hypothetical protein
MPTRGRKFRTLAISACRASTHRRVRFKGKGSVPIGIAIPFFVLGLLAVVYNTRALLHLAPDRPGALWSVLRRGPLAPRELFSPQGWQYWKLSFVLAGVSLCVLLAWVLGS